MPDLNATQTKLDYDKCNRALLYAYMYRWISLVAVDGQFVYQYNGVGRSFLIQSMGKIFQAKVINYTEHCFIIRLFMKTSCHDLKKSKKRR